MHVQYTLLSNWHMSFSWPLGWHVLWRLPFDARPCTMYNAGSSSIWGIGPWVRGMHTWHILFPTRKTIYFSKNEPGPVYETLPLVLGGGSSHQLQIASFMSLPFDDSTRESNLVRDDPKLLHNGGEIPKYQGKGWRFDSRLWNLLSTWQKTC
jgi:hypothetical protein